MKTIVSVQEIDELEIKPHAEVAEWRRLVTEEMGARWADRSDWLTVGCPVGDNGAPRAAFEHAGIAYVECTTCGSLYAPQRPGEAALRDWYRSSRPASFWRERLLTASSEARLDKIVRPRAQWVLDGIAEYVPRARRLLDVSANGRELIDELMEGASGFSAVAAGVTADLEGPETARVRVNPTSVVDLSSLGPVDLVTALDAFDRSADLPCFVKSIYDTLSPGGVLFATLPVSSGFEVQSLWDRSPTVFPPDKLNLPSLDGLLRLFGGDGWELLELSTPGMFDVEIVRRCVAGSPEAEWPRVLRALVLNADAAAQQTFIEYLQSRRLTSFARIVARREG